MLNECPVTRATCDRPELCGDEAHNYCSRKDLRIDEPRGQYACPICGHDKPHHHDQYEVELERYCRPAFERWAEPQIRHLNQGHRSSIGVHYGMVPQWNQRDSIGYVEQNVEVAWQSFRQAWFASDAIVRKPRRPPHPAAEPREGV